VSLRITALAFAVLLLIAVELAGAEVAPGLLYEDSIYTSEYGLSLYPDYPPLVGQTLTLRLRTFKPAQKVTLYSDREQEIPMVFHDSHWWGTFKMPSDYQTGHHFFTVWIKYSPSNIVKPSGWFTNLLEKVRLGKRFNTWWSKSVVWYQVGTENREQAKAKAQAQAEVEEKEEELPPPVTGEAVEFKVVSSSESIPLIIKGSQSITFKSRSLEGSKEGYTSGTSQSREETLRVSIAGKADDTEINATLFRSSALGVATVAEQEEKISILLRRGSTEAYLGDFTADFTETEFCVLDKVLSGGRLKGDYGWWGFNALYSSPKGAAKFVRMYGNSTQGPYALGSAPVVIDSERICLDGALQTRGNDYTIDYQAGTFTFIKKVVDPKSILQIYYDYRQTVYAHATYGLRGYINPFPNMKIGATYLEDSDSLAGAEVIRSSMSSEAIDPQKHYVVGVDGNLLAENIALAGEAAYSFRDLNLLSPTGTEETGKAVKFSLNSSLGPFGITGQLKKVGAKFRPIGDPDPKQDIWEYAGGLSFRPWALFGARTDYNYQKYTQSGVVYENLYKATKAQLTPDKLPSLEYNFSEHDESNDPVTGTAIRRIITKNAAESNYQLGFWSANLKGTLEKWLRRSPSEEVTDYKRVNVGLATVGIEKITFSSNAELEERREPDGTKPYRKTYNLNLSATPSKNYFVSSSLQVLDDSAQGNTSVIDLSYRAQPTEIFKTDGKYTINSVREDFPTTSEAVYKQSGSFSFDFRPFSALRLRYLFRPNFTRLARTQTISYNNEQQQAEINLFPTQYSMLGVLYKLGRAYSVYKNDYPNYVVREKTEDTDSTLYTLKLAPWQILSTEFNYLLENGMTSSLASTMEPYVYTPGRSAVRQYDASVKTSLSERFAIDTRYSYQKKDQGTGEAASNLVNSKTQTLSLKGTWNASEMWSFSLIGAYSRTTDYILSNLTYTLAPGFGFIYRWQEKFRVDFDYTYSKAYAGAETVKTNYLLRAKYNANDFVSLNLRVEREISTLPDYRLTDITGNVEINL
jgi:hypothetical protein